MFTEDLTQFFAPDEFAFNATLSGAAVRGIFDNAHIATDPGMGMSTTNPVFIMASSDVPANPVGRPLIVNGVTYNIAAYEPDGTGISELILERTS